MGGGRDSEKEVQGSGGPGRGWSSFVRAALECSQHHVCLGRALKLLYFPCPHQGFLRILPAGQLQLSPCVRFQRPDAQAPVCLCPNSLSSFLSGLLSKVFLLQICDFVDAEPRPIWHKAGASGVPVSVLGAQHSPVGEADATLWLWGSRLCGESGTALV